MTTFSRQMTHIYGLVWASAPLVCNKLGWKVYGYHFMHGTRVFHMFFTESSWGRRNQVVTYKHPYANIHLMYIFDQLISDHICFTVLDIVWILEFFWKLRISYISVQSFYHSLLLLYKFVSKILHNLYYLCLYYTRGIYQCLLYVIIIRPMWRKITMQQFIFHNLWSRT